jgi:hypothetical protein
VTISAKRNSEQHGEPRQLGDVHGDARPSRITASEDHDTAFAWGTFSAFAPTPPPQLGMDGLLGDPAEPTLTRSRHQIEKCGCKGLDYRACDSKEAQFADAC